MELYDSIPKRNVLIAVDVQNDFISGSLAVPEGEQVVSPINKLAERVRATHLGRVAFTRDWHPAQTPHFDAWPMHCVRNTEGAAFHADLDIRPTDTIISKGTGTTDGYSGMEGKAKNGVTLEAMIEPQGWEDVAVFVGGLATDYCVQATAIDVREAFENRRNVEVYAIREAMRGVNLQPGDDIAAINKMAEAGVKTISLKEAFTRIDARRLEQ
jgi:nicotinamidase/pyrazinamidase